MAEFTAEDAIQTLAELRKKSTDLSALGVPYSKALTYELIEAGKRVSDALNQKIHDHGWWTIRSRWMVFRLQDGTSSGDLFDTKIDAVRWASHHGGEFRYAYICFRGLGHGASPKESAVFLKYNRDLYDRGARMPDPESINGGRDIVMQAWQRDRYRRTMGI